MLFFYLWTLIISIYFIAFEFKILPLIRYLFYFTLYAPYLLLVSSYLLLYTNSTEIILLGIIVGLHLYTVISNPYPKVLSISDIENFKKKSENFQLISLALKNDIKYRIIHSEILDPNKQYIFTVHPHASWAFGSNILANSGILKFHIFLMVHKIFFFLPFLRSMANYFYFMACDKESIQSVLNSKYSIMIVPGGEEEMLRSRIHSENVYISNRTGIFHLAIKNKTPIVPILNYNETDAYYNWNTDNAINIRKMLKKFFGTYFQFAFGKIESLGIMPRVPVKLEFVIGKPIYDSNIHLFKSKYIDELKRMRSEFPPSDPTREFSII